MSIGIQAKLSMSRNSAIQERSFVVERSRYAAVFEEDRNSLVSVGRGADAQLRRSGPKSVILS